MLTLSWFLVNKPNKSIAALETMVETRFNVGMTCEGCAGAVKRILGKMDGVTDIQTDVQAKTVVVQADESVSPEDMLAKLKKWGEAAGKSVELA